MVSVVFEFDNYWWRGWAETDGQRHYKICWPDGLSSRADEDDVLLARETYLDLQGHFGPTTDKIPVADFPPTLTATTKPRQSKKVCPYIRSTML